MKKKYFHFFCDKCEEKSKKIPPSDLPPFLSKHFDKNCPSEGIKVFYRDGAKLKISNTEYAEDPRAVELKNYLSKIRKILKDFVNMPEWGYGKDVENIIEKSIKLRGKIVEDLKQTEEEIKDDLESS